MHESYRSQLKAVQSVQSLCVWSSISVVCGEDKVLVPPSISSNPGDVRDQCILCPEVHDRAGDNSIPMTGATE